MSEYEEYWKNEFESLSSESKDLIVKSPDAKDVIESVLKTISDVVSLASCTPVKVGQNCRDGAGRQNESLCNTPGETAF